MTSRRMKSIALIQRHTRLLSDQQSLQTAAAAAEHGRQERLQSEAEEQALSTIAELHQHLRPGELLHPDRYHRRAEIACERLGRVQIAIRDRKVAEGALDFSRAEDLRLRLRLDTLADRGDTERKRLAEEAASRFQKESDDRWVMRNTRMPQ